MVLLNFKAIRGVPLRVPLKGYYKGTTRVPLKGSIRDMGVSEN